MHIAEAHFGDKIKCQICSKEFKNKNGFKHHIQCYICMKAFHFNGILNRHIAKVHFGDKIKCQICSKEFKSTKGLEHHIQIIHDFQDFHNKQSIPDSLKNETGVMEKYTHSDSSNNRQTEVLYDPLKIEPEKSFKEDPLEFLELSYNTDIKTE